MFDRMNLAPRRWALTISILVSALYSSGQDSTRISPDTIVAAPVIPTAVTDSGEWADIKRNRIRLLAAGNVAAYAGSMTLLYNAWYRDYPQTHFHFFNDNREWLQVDKAGHAFSAYVASRASMEMWRWAGMKRKPRIWIGGMSGAVYQTVIETLDGFSAEWGWSWGDFAANVFGSGLLVAQELAWDEQRISMKFSTHQLKYPAGALAERADHLFGRSAGERFLKDYNAQTIWLSANLKAFMPRSGLPGWLNLAVGYGAGGMYGGISNSWVDQNGLAHHRSDIPRYRQFFLAPDIDLTRIRTRSKPLKVALFLLNSFKFPAPSLEFSQGRIRGRWLHF